jgi:hypothetical protein
MRTILSLFVLLFGCIAIHAQGFPWNDFKERKISDMISITTKAVRADDSMFMATDVLSTRSEVIFTGKSRPISISKKRFLQWWAGMLHHGEGYDELYDTEYLYKDGDLEYWLPTQTPITKYFAKELKPDDKVVLFLISAGAYREQNKIECVVLVEEYQLRKNLEKVIKAAGTMGMGM